LGGVVGWKTIGRGVVGYDRGLAEAGTPP